MADENLTYEVVDLLQAALAISIVACRKDGWDEGRIRDWLEVCVRLAMDSILKNGAK